MARFDYFNILDFPIDLYILLFFSLFSVFMIVCVSTGYLCVVSFETNFNNLNYFILTKNNKSKSNSCYALQSNWQNCGAQINICVN